MRVTAGVAATGIGMTLQVPRVRSTADRTAAPNVRRANAEGLSGLPGSPGIKPSHTCAHHTINPDEGRQPVANEDLARCYQQAGCAECLAELLERNTSLVHHVLKRFPHSREPYEDLLQVGRLGLLKAIRRYDAERGHAFSTYAVAAIDGEVRHYLRDSVLMRQPRWARTAHKRIEEAQTAFYLEHRRFPTMSELACLVNITEEGVTEVIRVCSQSDVESLDNADRTDESQATVSSSRVRALRQESFSLPIEDRIALQQALATLSIAQRKLIYLLYFRDLSQQEVADELGMTQRNVSREQHRALSKLKAILTKKIF